MKYGFGTISLKLKIKAYLYEKEQPTASTLDIIPYLHKQNIFKINLRSYMKIFTDICTKPCIEKNTHFFIIFTHCIVFFKLIYSKV